MVWKWLNMTTWCLQSAVGKNHQKSSKTVGNCQPVMHFGWLQTYYLLILSYLRDSLQRYYSRGRVSDTSYFSASLSSIFKLCLGMLPTHWHRVCQVIYHLRKGSITPWENSQEECKVHDLPAWQPLIHPQQYPHLIMKPMVTMPNPLLTMGVLMAAVNWRLSWQLNKHLVIHYFIYFMRWCYFYYI